MPRDGTLVSVVRGVCNDLEISYPEDEIMVQWVRALRGLTSVEAERAPAQSMTVHEGPSTTKA